MTASTFGYNASWKTLIIGSTGTDYTTTATTICFGVDVSGNTSGSYSGSGYELMFRNTGSFITPNSGNTSYNTLLSWNSSGQLTFNNAATFSSNVTLGANIYTPTDSLNLYSGTVLVLNAGGGNATLGIPAGWSGSLNIQTVNSSSPIIFNTSGSERARFVPGGSLLVNYTSVWNNEKFGIQIQNSNNWTNVPAMMRLTNYGSGYITKMTFTDSSIIDGIFGMIPVSGSSYFVMGFAGFTEQGFKLYQNGNLTIAGTITESSSIRYKENVETLRYGLDKVVQLRGVTYNKKDTGIKEIGLIAEEVESILPDVILRNQEGEPDSVSYGRITAVLIEAIKELKMEIEELKRR
jgi:hypothetical protein